MKRHIIEPISLEQQVMYVTYVQSNL